MDFVGQSTAPIPVDVRATIEFFCKDALDTMVARWKEKQMSA